MFEMEFYEDFQDEPTNIKVVGIGGGGGKIVSYMVRNGVKGPEFIIMNTDIQDLRKHQADKKIQLGRHTTKGRGAGSDPSKGRRAAEESAETVREALMGADVVFVVACLGGGTGTGAAPVVAKVAKENNALTIGVATLPFDFEGAVKKENAVRGIEELRKNVDTLIVLSNNKLAQVAGSGVSIIEAFDSMNDFVSAGIRAISDLITQPGEINLDLADLDRVLRESGDALLGVGEAGGEGRAREAIRKAMGSPFLENATVEGATKILVNIWGSESDLSLLEVKEIMDAVTQESKARDNDIVFGVTTDPAFEGRIKVALIATGYPSPLISQSNAGELSEDRRYIKPSSDSYSSVEKDYTKEITREGVFESWRRRF